MSRSDGVDGRVRVTMGRGDPVVGTGMRVAELVPETVESELAMKLPVTLLLLLSERESDFRFALMLQGEAAIGVGVHHRFLISRVRVERRHPGVRVVRVVWITRGDALMVTSQEGRGVVVWRVLWLLSGIV